MATTPPPFHSHPPQSAATGIRALHLCPEGSDPGRGGHAWHACAHLSRKTAFLCKSQGTSLTSYLLHCSEVGHTQNHCFAGGERQRERKKQKHIPPPYWVLTFTIKLHSVCLFLQCLLRFTGNSRQKKSGSVHANLPRRGKLEAAVSSRWGKIPRGSWRDRALPVFTELVLPSCGQEANVQSPSPVFSE